MSPLPPTRIGTRPGAPDGTGRDGTGQDRRDEGEGRPAPRVKAGSALLAPQAARGGSGPAVTWPRGRAAGPRDMLRVRAGARAPLALESCLLPLASLAPLPVSPSFFPSLAVAPSPPGLHVTQDSPNT